MSHFDSCCASTGFDWYSTLPVLISAGFDKKVARWESYEEEEEVPDATTVRTPEEMNVEGDEVPGAEEQQEAQEVLDVSEVPEQQELQEQQERQEQQGQQGENTDDEPQDSHLSVIEERRRKKCSRYYKRHPMCK